MDPMAYLLRKFRFVKGLEQSLLQLRKNAAGLESENRKMRAEMAYWTRFCPLGHFYSPLPSMEEVAAVFPAGVTALPSPASISTLTNRWRFCMSSPPTIPICHSRKRPRRAGGTTSQTLRTGATTRSCFTA